jgi:hypothetical protein
VTNNGRPNPRRHLHRVAGRAEPGLGHADDRDVEGKVRMRSRAGPAHGIKVGVAVDGQQAQPGHDSEHGPQRRQLPPVELAEPYGSTAGTRTVRSTSTGGGTRIRGVHGGRTRAAGGQIVHICRHEYVRTHVTMAL